jgi:hypothetical protein
MVCCMSYRFGRDLFPGNDVEGVRVPVTPASADDIHSVILT